MNTGGRRFDRAADGPKKRFNKELSDAMQFIELTGKTLWRVIDHDDEQLTTDDLRKAGVQDDSVVRVNRQGDIELRKAGSWDVIGGLLGNYEQRLHDATGLDWAEEQ